MVSKRKRAAGRRVERIAAREARAEAGAEIAAEASTENSATAEAGGDASTAVEENVGVLVSTSEQEVAALTAEADAALNAAPAESAPGEVAGAPDQAAVAVDELQRAQIEAQQYVGGCYVAINAIANVVAPNWHVDANEKKELAEAFALAAALWFPGMYIPPKYVALFGIGAVVWGIGAKRYDPETKQLLPLRVEKKADGAQAA